MDIDFSRSSKKLQLEQNRRKEEAKLKLAKERALQEQAEKKQAEIEEQIKKKRLEDSRKQEEERKRAVEEAIKSGGICYSELLLGLKISGEGDKILLPASALETLTQQDAFSHGAMMFELKWGNKMTHAGVLEFTAEENTIGLPPKVIQSLGVNPQEDHPPLTDVQVKYVRLEKGTFAQLRPEKAGLSQIDEIRAVLEQNMRNHTTLTVGDVLSVWFRGRAYTCEVIQLKPQNQVSLIDTDLELDLDLPTEVVEEEKRRSPAGTALGRKHLETEVQTHFTSAQASHMSDDSDEEMEDPEEIKRKHRETKAGVLPEEPEPGSKDSIICALRSDSETWSRRFFITNKFQSLFDFAESCGIEPEKYKIIQRFPRKSYMPNSTECEKTFAEIGITASETFLLEFC